MRAIAQTVQVSFCYQVCFTSHLFDRDNPLLAEVLGAARQPAQAPHKALFVVDGEVATHHRVLTREILAYCQAHAETISL
jgi:3-dehydroquinate synthase